MTPVFVLFLAPLLFEAAAYPSNPVVSKPVDCDGVYYQNRSSQSGVHIIYPSDPRFGVPVYCDMDTPGGPWTVIQRRMDGTVNFHRGWDQYVAGFGDVNGEYWLGLEFIHKITMKKQKLLVEMTDFEGGKASAMYSSFSVGGDCDGYKLIVSGFTNGGAGDSLTYHNHRRFSTFDKDQDHWGNNCAKVYGGGYWFNNCHHSGPNGEYLWGNLAQGAPAHRGIIWNSWKGNIYSLKSISFKIHPV